MSGSISHFMSSMNTPVSANPVSARNSAVPPGPLFNWLKQRGAGVLLHPTSFPGPGGVGTLKIETVETWLSFLSDAGFRYWQVCPLGPTGYGDSPYQCFSAFAGNPYLIDLETLQTFGLLSADDRQPEKGGEREDANEPALIFQLHENRKNQGGFDRGDTDGRRAQRADPQSCRHRRPHPDSCRC